MVNKKSSLKWKILISIDTNAEKDHNNGAKSRKLVMKNTQSE
jgi:hypothetical protein